MGWQKTAQLCARDGVESRFLLEWRMLGLGIGANTLVFGVLKTFMLHPLNVAKEESLYQSGESAARGVNGRGSYHKGHCEKSQRPTRLLRAGLYR